MKRSNCLCFVATLIASLLMFIAGAVDAIVIDTVTVGDVGNVGDTRAMVVGGAITGYGRVNYAYNIGKYEVTAGQYTAFLNAVGGIDTFSLYNTNMSDTSSASGITR